MPNLNTRHPPPTTRLSVGPEGEESVITATFTRFDARMFRDRFVVILEISDDHVTWQTIARYAVVLE